ncbi:unnamed protein product [Macrosiphum euphorbiae]|uniref:Uncharacterized protein n=1 Tax=Macrosiphum euphorbiae TaxID=13131 RepID=A0AAV0YAD3_9HEMI|nr:unnamed protein product [Macrosiphum euphorbiae]
MFKVQIQFYRQSLSVSVTITIENQIEVDDSIITSISDHLQTLKDNFDSYSLSEMENYQQMKWISNPFQEHDMTSGLSIRAKEELIELFEDSV